MHYGRFDILYCWLLNVSYIFYLRLNILSRLSYIISLWNISCLWDILLNSLRNIWLLNILSCRRRWLNVLFLCWGMHYLSFDCLIFNSFLVSFLWYVFDIFILINLWHVFDSLLISFLWDIFYVFVLVYLRNVLSLIFYSIVISYLFFPWNIFCS